MKAKTKAQREAEDKEALRQRIEDIAVGAEGEGGPATNDWWANAHCLSRFVPALKAQFGMDEKGEERKDRNCFWYPVNLYHFDNVDTTTEFFWDHGVRA